jgi:O-methyltransferase
VYDSFVGLPPKLPQDASPAGFAFQAGELTATKAHFVQNFKKAQLPLPIIHKGWFETIAESDVPSPIAFAFLDGDYFSSIQSSLLLVESKLSPGAVIIIDDYLSSTLPGAKKAADAWMAQRNLSCTVRAGMAIIKT